MHQCAPGVCDPRPVSGGQGNVYRCRQGVVHACSEATCALYGQSATLTCPISGIQYGQWTSPYDRNDPRTWYAKGEATAPSVIAKRQRFIPSNRPRRMTVEEARDYSTSVVKLLLYSRHRVARNERARSEMRQHAQTAALTYRCQQLEAGQLPYFTDLYRLNGALQSRPLPYRIFCFDEALCRYYVGVMLQMWEVVVKYYVPAHDKLYDADRVTEVLPPLNYGIFCIGVLYGMRWGLRRGTLQVLPHDAFLEQNLPEVNDLPAFDLEMSDVSKGDAMLAQAVDNAVAVGAPASEYTVDAGALPVVDARMGTVERVGAIAVKIGANGPWFSALSFNTSDACKKATHIGSHTCPHLELDDLNRSNQAAHRRDPQNCWVMMMKIGPFDRWSTCVRFSKLWREKRGKRRRLERGLELFERFRQGYRLRLWAQRRRRDEAVADFGSIPIVRAEDEDGEEEIVVAAAPPMAQTGGGLAALRAALMPDGNVKTIRDMHRRMEQKKLV